MITIQSSKLRLGLDEAGRICSLEDLAAGGANIIESPADGAFFLVLDDAASQCKETLVWADAQAVTCIHADECSASFAVKGLQTDNGRPDAGIADISLTLHVKAEDDQLSFTADIDNRTDMRITDFVYPRLGKIRSLGDGTPALYWPEQPGRIYTGIGARLSNAYRHREHGANEMSITYPGAGMMGMCALLDEKNSLFFELHDPTFLAASLKVESHPDDRGALTLSANKFLCIKNEKMTTAPVVVRLYEGDWHYGARRYADFMAAHRPGHVKPDWIRDMTGYFLVINKQQFGYEMWDYTTLPQLWELAEAHGCSTLALFGWYQTGHDNNYPDLAVSHTMGGEEVLKENIKAVQAKGGRVMLYYQGHLIDTGSDYYKSGMGEHVACKTNWGTPYPEFYVKSHMSDMVSRFSKKTFVIGCPSCPEWRELMVEREKWVASLGADGTLYDQLGGMPPYPCFDESHPHDGNNPARALPGGQTKLLDALQTGAKAINPTFAFMSEHITDLYSARLDAVHGIGNMPGGRGDRANRPGTDACAVVTFPDLFRFCFPDAIITIRNPQPYVDRRAVNYAFAFGFPIEMELRYRADREDVLADKFAEKREYAAKIAALRVKYKDMLARGTYIDDECVENPAPTMIAKAFESEGTVAVTLWNDSAEARTPAIAVCRPRSRDALKLVRFETADGLVSDKLEEMAADSVAVAIYQK